TVCWRCFASSATRPRRSRSSPFKGRTLRCSSTTAATRFRLPDVLVARFFIITINYAPEPSGFAPHATQIAEYLGAHGHDVAVFTGFPFAPAWRRRELDRGRFFARERAGNVEVHRLTHFIPRRPSSVP